MTASSNMCSWSVVASKYLTESTFATEHCVNRKLHRPNMNAVIIYDHFRFSINLKFAYKKSV